MLGSTKHMDSLRLSGKCNEVRCKLCDKIFWIVNVPIIKPQIIACPYCAKDVVTILPQGEVVEEDWRLLL